MLSASYLRDWLRKLFPGCPRLSCGGFNSYYLLNISSAWFLLIAVLLEMTVTRWCWSHLLFVWHKSIKIHTECVCLLVPGGWTDGLCCSLECCWHVTSRFHIGMFPTSASFCLPISIFSPLPSIWHQKLWWLSGGLSELFYIANVLSVRWAQLMKTVHTARLSLVFLWLHDLSVGFYMFSLTLVIMFWRWRNKLKWTPFEVFAPSPLVRLGAGSIRFRAIVNKQAMRDEGLFMLLVDVQDSQSVSISKNVIFLLSHWYQPFS